MQSADLTLYGDLSGVGLGLALGLLIGIQRGWALRKDAPGTRFAGIRTFALLGLAGAIAGALQERAEGLAIILLAATAALVLIGYWRSAQRNSSISGTASLVGLLTMACGFLAGSGMSALASAAAGVMVVLLAMRSKLHGWLRTLDEVEMIAIARFALIALVILPLLPDTPFGPFGAWRPRQLWLVVVLVSGFSFAGYFAARHLGPTRGILATAAAGSMVSSTAVTASLAGKLRHGNSDPAILSAGIALASGVMFIRVMVLTAALTPFALPTLAVLAIPGMLVSLAAALAMIRRRHPDATPPQAGIALRNPLTLGPALLMMVLVMILSVAARWVLARYGDAGLAIVLALTGTVDVDSAIITMGNLPPGTLEARLAGLVLLPPVILNTLFKAGAVISIAGWHKGWRAAATLIASAAACGAALPFVL
jgi:uncharacterized membrane protein (DUF4010 family)